jgi:3'-phosphoadenosine 5'-phosphosulfate sulfotransferase (PAPS reductase)/FAD synthetase
MKNYLSFGAGVNSTALMLYLLDKGVGFESVFVNHGTDYPETYEYVQYLKDNGYRITVIKPNFEGFDNLYEYCRARKFLPSLQKRWCTYRFKLKPIRDYVERPCTMFIGISFDEKDRAKPKEHYYKKSNSIRVEYPLIDAQITREDCKKIILSHGLKVPPKSGCWICPAQTHRQIIQLYVHHPDLFQKVVDLEKIRGNRHTLKEKPFTYYVPWKTLPLLEGNNHE